MTAAEVDRTEDEWWEQMEELMDHAQLLETRMNMMQAEFAKALDRIREGVDDA